MALIVPSFINPVLTRALDACLTLVDVIHSFLVYSSLTGLLVILDNTVATGSIVISSFPPNAPPIAGVTTRILL